MTGVQTCALPISPQQANPDSNMTQIDFTTKKNKVIVNPTDNSQSKLMAHHEMEGSLILENGYSKFLRMLQEKKMTVAKKKKEKNLKKKYDESGMKANMQQEYGKEKGERVYFAKIRKEAMKEGSECGCDDDKEKNDKRSLPTTKSLIASKFQSMGVKNPVVMAASYEPEGEVIDETRLGYKAQELEMKRSSEGDVEGAKRARKLKTRQFTSAADPEKQRKARLGPQQAEQRRKRRSAEEDRPEPRTIGMGERR